MSVLEWIRKALAALLGPKPVPVRVEAERPPCPPEGDRHG